MLSSSSMIHDEKDFSRRKEKKIHARASCISVPKGIEHLQRVWFHDWDLFFELPRASIDFKFLLSSLEILLFDYSTTMDLNYRRTSNTRLSVPFKEIGQSNHDFDNCSDPPALLLLSTYIQVYFLLSALQQHHSCAHRFVSRSFNLNITWLWLFPILLFLLSLWWLYNYD